MPASVRRVRSRAGSLLCPLRPAVLSARSWRWIRRALQQRAGS
jgi:hypothetical protein